MVQKALKVKTKAKDPRRVTKKQKNLRKAAPLIIKSKKKQLHYLKNLNRTASLTEKTEKLVSAKVGHLELLKGTRRELEKSKRKDDSKK
ncbi:uncharacterized protein KNAG_0D04140 [Huiozyma naganishii CBS 8797]|uniref:Uncharacterized protein n=1 Tax=Huiozyma naganishii (strain ATCC MYA-139 / BCRC 22969 / CBS 8797 / KCTC 17520 / NBRC 10181 / NCYC 3082 / Yp74L-3) TaxID=1071383 RepID=J7R5M8_HUIN7|nr:hypothetical protein KNAG_0D04140 [Kazachstania naganishii CBS 8797]CCK70160.1 hypothetical protein KNAG_0D04140 [Kazachstania naganishii CBS 8797]